jgi:hypothetical protein
MAVVTDQIKQIKPTKIGGHKGSRLQTEFNLAISIPVSGEVTIFSSFGLPTPVGVGLGAGAALDYRSFAALIRQPRPVMGHKALGPVVFRAVGGPWNRRFIQCCQQDDFKHVRGTLPAC